MKKYFYLLVIFLAAFSQNILGQNDPKTACTVENGRIVFKYNLTWDSIQRKQFMNLFNIDSVILAKALSGVSSFTEGNEMWKVKKISSQIVELSKNLNDVPANKFNLDEILLAFNGLSYFIPSSENVKYGVNKLDANNVFKYSDGIAEFYLPNRENARKVYISGSFNNWSTTQLPMHKSDSGWVIALKLKPGKYLYKYIIDGRWTHDPNNNFKEKNDQGSYNSVIYCYNYKFELANNTKANKVFVAGSFNGWNPKELPLSKTSTGWTLPMFLSEGTHAYKFVVDGQWITDPNCKVNRPDGRGNTNSYVGIGDEYIFKLNGYLNANKVFLAGNFNDWNSAELQMERTNDGWQLPYALAAGNYEYKFIVDGKWTIDPQNPYTIGGGDVINSFFAFKANHVFVLNKFPNAQKVFIAGAFNGWNPSGYKMVKKDGKWIFSVYLNPGKYTYKYIVDGQWILDPDNKLWEENEYGTGNSVLWIEP